MYIAVKNNDTKDEQLKKIINLLTFLSQIDDIDVIKASLESVVEMLQELK